MMCYWMAGSMCVVSSLVMAPGCLAAAHSQVILPNHGLLESHAQLDNILAMVPDEDVRATISDRFKVCVYLLLWVQARCLTRMPVPSLVNGWRQRTRTRERCDGLPSSEKLRKLQENEATQMMQLRFDVAWCAC